MEQLLRTLHNNKEIISKYTIYNNGKYVIAEHNRLDIYNIVILSEANFILSYNEVYNSDNFNYFAIKNPNNTKYYIIKREKIINDYTSGLIPYSLVYDIKLDEEYLNNNAAKILDI